MDNLWRWLNYPLVMTNIAMVKITMFYGKIHYKWPFSIAMFVYQRVPHCQTNPFDDTWRVVNVPLKGFLIFFQQKVLRRQTMQLMHLLSFV